MKSLLAYWVPETADAEAGALLDHAASEQFGRVTPGDHVWIVIVRERVLYLIGRIVVGSVTNQAGAQKMLGRTGLWSATKHIVAAKSTTLRVGEIDITELAPSLRFVSKRGRDRLNVTDGVDAKQLQTMRVLAPASATALEQIGNGVFAVETSP